MPSVEASLANLEIARVRHRPWRPWRSQQESWQIRHLVFQWFISHGPKWFMRALARWLGVHHRHVQKLREEFRSNPRKIWKEVRESGFEAATFEHLQQAREITRQMAERSLLRPLRHSTWGERRIIWPSLRIPQEIPFWATPEYSMFLANSGMEVIGMSRSPQNLAV